MGKFARRRRFLQRAHRLVFNCFFIWERARRWEILKTQRRAQLPHNYKPLDVVSGLLLGSLGGFAPLALALRRDTFALGESVEAFHECRRFRYKRGFEDSLRSR